MKLIIASLSIFLTVSSFAQVNIVPKPMEIKKDAGVFLINDKTIIFANTDQHRQEAKMLNFYLKNLCGFELQTLLQKPVSLTKDTV